MPSDDSRVCVRMQIKHRIQHSLGTAMRRLHNKCHSLRKQAERSDDNSATSKMADMIMANLYQIPPGAASFAAEDWDSGGW